jgi:outer membrane protein OmpA-like peptidoglycan-associated protein
MKMRFRQSTRLTFLAIVCFGLLAGLTSFAAESRTASGKKTKIKAVIIVHDGDLVTAKDTKDGATETIVATAQTKIERSGTSVGPTALVPGMTIKVVGTTNEQGQLEAKTIKVYFKGYDVAVAQQQEILENKAAAKRAQESADEGIGNAAVAQKSADQAQSTANEGVSTAQAAGTLAATNAVEVGKVNQRVSDLSQYDAVAQTGIYFPENGYKLNKTSKAALDQLVAANSNLAGYVIEIAGYTSSTGSAQHNQWLSARRAEAVAQYLREKDDVPAYRIAVPAGYGKTHPAAENSDREGRAKNRRVEVTILVSKGSQENTQISSVQ